MIRRWIGRRSERGRRSVPLKRLFARFYLGVLAICVVAIFAVGWLARWRNDEADRRFLESTFSSGALAAAALLERSDDVDRELERLRRQTDTSLTLVEREDYLPDNPLSQSTVTRLDDGEAVFDNQTMIAPVGEGRLLLWSNFQERGPPPEREIWTALGVVLGSTALFVLLLLRPVFKSLRAIEHTAGAIADGDLSARVADRPGRTLLAESFDSMADRVERLLSRQRELLQAVSHELRTPLARIKFASELARTAKDDNGRLRRLAAIDDAAADLDALVGELLDYIRLDGSGDREVNVAESSADVCDACGEAVDVGRLLHPSIDLELTCHASSGIAAATEPRLLARAVGNLVGNAVKFAESKVRVTVDRAADGVVIAVEDDGPGVPPEERAGIFEPFRRGGDRTAPGVGLGLALVRRICRRSGGEVVVDDSELGGAKFQMTLPTA